MTDSDLADWLHRIPDITRYWFVGSVVIPVLCRFGFIPLQWCYLDYDLVIRNLQVWRPLTALFAYPITPRTGFHFLIMLYFLYNYSTRLEMDHFTGRRADYLFMLMFNWAVGSVVGLFVDIPFLLECMVMSVLYVWCQCNADTMVQFYFGTQFKAMYLPWILLLFNFIVNSKVADELTGIFIGYLYYFLTYRYPEEVGGESLLRTPAILYRWLPNRVGGVHGFGHVPDSRRPRPDDRRGRSHNWGPGHVLGGS